ncbi:MAG: ATP-binding protein [Sporolactobacillus sp.]
MRNPGIDYKKLIRWLLLASFLIYTVVISDHIITLSCSRQDEQLLGSEAAWITALAGTASGKQLLQEGALERFAKQQKVSIALYDLRGRQIAAAGGAGDRRLFLSQTDKKSFFYIEGNRAVYQSVVQQGGRESGYLRIQGVRSRIYGLNVLYSLFLLLGLALMAYRERLEASYNVPVRFAAQMAEAVLDGNYRLIASDSVAHESVLHMNLAMNRLSDRLHEFDRLVTRQRSSIETLIENIGNGLILIDGNRRVSYVNETFKETFKTTAAHWLMADFDWAIPYEDVREMVADVFQQKIRIARQLQLAIRIERRYFDVSCAPILDSDKRVRGIVVVFHDITDIKRLENVRKDFVANVSHELKTPITSIIGFTETLLDGAKDDAQSVEAFLQIILHEGQRLQSLVADLLDLSKIEREHFTIDWQQVSLSQLLQTVLPLFQEKVRAKQIALTVKNNGEGVAAGDPYRIRQIMINLINNAISYTPPGGKVTVSIFDQREWSVFIVSDTGIGIAADQIPRIFERFYRVDKARSRESGGTGLGLAIVKHLVEAHNGNIDVASQPGKGTTFTISFKKKAPAVE